MGQAQWARLNGGSLPGGIAADIVQVLDISLGTIYVLCAIAGTGPPGMELRASDRQSNP